MFSYVLRHDEAGAVRLYLLDRPTDRRFWHAWTEEEIAESEAQAQRGGLAALFVVEIHASCGCGSFIERWIKFYDGIAVECRTAQPRHEPDFFDNASDFGLPP